MSSKKILAFDTRPKILRSTISLLDNTVSTLMSTWGGPLKVQTAQRVWWTHKSCSSKELTTRPHLE